MEEEILFAEKQRFNQWWLWLILLIGNGVAVLNIYKRHDLSHGIAPWIPIAITALVTILIVSSQLNTRITQSGIYVRFYPFHRKFRFYPWDAIQKLYLRKYSPIGEYGGFGIRYSGNGTAFNTSGNMGLQLELQNNKRLLIGTKKAADLSLVLEKLNRLQQGN